MKETLKISATLQVSLNLDSVIQMIILVHSLKKENKELMAKFNLNQTYSFVRKLH